jgi:hypothetical protein
MSLCAQAWCSACSRRRSFSITRERDAIRFDGLLDDDGIIRAEKAGQAREETFLGYLADYLDRVSRE